MTGYNEFVHFGIDYETGAQSTGYSGTRLSNDRKYCFDCDVVVKKL